MALAYLRIEVKIEEEALARNILDKIKLIGDDKGGFYLFDNDIKQLITAVPPQQ